VKLDFISTLTLCFFAQALCAQGVPVGQWRSHLPFNETHSIAILNDEIMAASNYGLLRFNSSENIISDFTKVDGLNGVELTEIESSPNGIDVLLGYEDGLMELWNSDIIREIPDIPQSGKYPGKSSINAFVFDGEDRAFAATGFGVVELDLLYGVVKGTYLLKDDGNTTETYNVDIDNDSLYVAAETGLWSASLGDPLYLFSSWNQCQRWADTAVNDISISGADYLVSKNESGAIWLKKDGIWLEMYLNNSDKFEVRRISKTDNGYLVIRDFDIIYIDTLGIQRQVYSSGLSNNDNFSPRDAKISSNGVLWIANAGKGISFIDNPDYVQHRKISGPPSSSVFEVSSSLHGIEVFSGAIDPTWTATYCNEGVFLFNQENWSVLSSEKLNDAKDILAKVVDPSDTSHWFVSSWGKGVLEFKDGELETVWDNTNSSLMSASGSTTNDVRTGGLCWGEDGALWVTNALSNSPLHRFNPTTGQWKAFGLGAFNGLSIKNIIQGSDGVFWIQSRTNGLMAVKIQESTVNLRRLTTGVDNGNLPSSSVNSYVFDKDDELWIGTSDGLVVSFTPGNAMNGNSIDAQALLVEENGIVQKVLSGENVLAIAVDGANRKWIGTSDGGLFLLSYDGLETLAHFTQSNSPLLSNRINSLAIDPLTGELFIGTSQGLISYRSDAVDPFDDFSNIQVFPNPYEPKDFGAMSIKGLIDGSYVKVTNTSGRLIFEGPATGGQFSWTTNGLDGSPAPSGIYLFWVTNPLGTLNTVVQGVIVRGE